MERMLMNAVTGEFQVVVWFLLGYSTVVLFALWSMLIHRPQSAMVSKGSREF